MNNLAQGNHTCIDDHTCRHSTACFCLGGAALGGEAALEGGHLVAPTIASLGHHENVSKTQGACGKGLAFLQKLIMAILSLCPQCHITKTRWRAAILDANNIKDFNSSGLGHRIWAGQRAERLLTIQSHLRRIFREPQRLVQAMEKMNSQDAKTLQSMVHKVVGDATMACDSEEEC